MLEFQGVCRQVASFASTPAAAEKAFKGRLEVGQTREASEELQAQTRDALRMLSAGGGEAGEGNDGYTDDYFQGIFDLRRALDAAEKDKATLHPLVIGAVATTIEAVLRLYERLVAEGDSSGMDESEGYRLAGLLGVHLGGTGPELDLELDLDLDLDLDGERERGDPSGARPASNARRESQLPLLLELAAEIRSKISVDGLILNTASESLGEVRMLKEENAVALQRQAEEWSRKMHACGAAERAQVVIRRDRRCIPIKAGRNGELPANSVCLGTSGSQSTMYMEPEPLISLNNFNIELTEAEEQEEEAVLKALSALVAKRAGLLRRIGAAVVRVDLAFARAKHARWVGGVLPEFCEREISCQDVMHPLLLQRTLEPLRVPRLPVRRGKASGGVLGTSALEGIDLVPEIWWGEHERGGGWGEQRGAGQRPGGVTSGWSEQRGAQRPVVHPTGNTPPDAQHGGANNGSSEGANATENPATENSPTENPATLITPISIMIPEGKRAVVVTGPNTGGKTASLKTFGLLSLMAKAGLGIPSLAPSLRCAWFDKVLVDVGDSQSLQQNLSTFSGHMTRISRILESATPQSLVLLDEVGSGTDPAEGAALAAAILDRLSHGGSAMTYVTTHHAELKESKDPAFLDANVEFDVRTLLPTYKIDWGSSGESHALAVAEGLGFDPAVVARAREIAKELKEERDEQKRTSDAAAMLKESLPDEIAQVEARIGRAERRAEQHEMMLSVLEEERRVLEEDGGEEGEEEDDVAERIRGILRDARAGTLSVGDADGLLRGLVDDAKREARAAVEDVYEGDIGWAPSVGESVAVLSMGGAEAAVVSVDGRKQTARIRAGMMEIGDVSFDDLRRLTRDGEGGKAKAKATKKKSAPSQQPSSPATTQQQPAIQTSANTVDLRGMTAEEARYEVEAAVGAARGGAVLFVIHGVGTGRVRGSVLGALRGNGRVRRVEQQEGSNGGCAIVWVE